MRRILSHERSENERLTSDASAERLKSRQVRKRFLDFRNIPSICSTVQAHKSVRKGSHLQYPVCVKKKIS